MGKHWTRQYGIVLDKNMRLVCPDCGKPELIQTGRYVSSDGALMERYKTCKNCGFSFSSVEIDTTRFVDLLEAEDALTKALADIEVLRSVSALVRDAAEVVNFAAEQITTVTDDLARLEVRKL